MTKEKQELTETPKDQQTKPLVAPEPIDMPELAIESAKIAAAAIPVQDEAPPVQEVPQPKVDYPPRKSALEYFQISRETEGWLTDAESDLLHLAATQAFKSSGNSWIEVGSYCGKSTVVIASVLASSPRDADFQHRLYAVDPFEGSLSFPSHYAPSGLMDSNRLDHVGSTREKFDATITKAELWPWVSVIDHPFSEFHPDEEPIDFIFIDGLHDYESIKADWEHAKKFLIDGATVAFHDYSQWEGVTRLVDEAIRAGDFYYTNHLHADSLIIFTYRIP